MKNVTGLKRDIYKDLEMQLKSKLKMLPEIAVKFLSSTNKKIRTQIEYAKDLSLFFDFILLHKKIEKENSSLLTIEHLKLITIDDVENFLTYLLEYEKQYETIKGKMITRKVENGALGIARKRATLDRFFSFLVKRDYLDKNVMEKLEDNSIPNTQDIKDRLEPDELQLLLDTILDGRGAETKHSEMFHNKVKLRDYTIVLLLAFTGIRIGELVQIDISDVKLKRGYVEVLRKGGNKERVIIPDRIAEEISEFVNNRRNMEVGSEALFLSLRQKRIKDSTVREMLLKYQQRSGIETHITPHLLRRTFGTVHYNTYRDMYLTAKVLGHSSAETTRKFYADPSKERVVDSMKRFNYKGRRDN